MSRAIVFDTETTGKNEAKMIEAAWIQLDSINPFVTSDEFNQRYNPGKPIELGALATHHILDEELIDCPSPESFELPQGLEYLIGHLGFVLPCSECQGHARDYFQNNRLGLVGLQGAVLRGTAELWLLNFHNAVRMRKGQEIMISTVDGLASVYDGCTIIKCTEDILGRAAKYAMDHRIVKAAAWKRWTTEFRKLKLSVGI